MDSPSRTPLSFLGGIPAFAGLDPAQLNRLYAFTALKVVSKGEPALVEGAVAGELGVILSGRVVECGAAADAKEYGQGEALEAEAFFLRRPAAATLIALRDTVLLTLGWDDLVAAFHAHPDLLASLFARIGAPGAFGRKPAKPARVVLCPAGAKGPLDEDVKAALLSALEEICEVRVLRRESFGSLALDSPDAAHWLQEQELEFDLTVITGDPADAAYAGQAIEEADEIVFFGSGGGPALSALEQHALARRGAERCRLVLVKGVGMADKEAAKWIAPRPYRTTQYIDPGASPGDISLIASSLAGKGHAVAAVSRGVHAAAILGALQAFEAAGESPVCLAAAGSAVLPAGLLACGASLAETEAVFEALANPQSWKRAVKADAALFEAGPADSALSDALPAREIALAARPFAAVSLSLSRNAAETQSRGRLQGAVRAGLAPRGLLPPLVTEEGDILVSGETEIEALIEAAARLSPSPVLLLYADAPALGASEMSYRQLTGATFWLTPFSQTSPVKRLRLETVLAAPCGRNPADIAERMGAHGFGVPIPEGVSPMDWAEWAALRDHAFEWASAEIEARRLAQA
ncbi:MAG: cyclic nucleotide-binding and patatin-like phospholipase domain-containing protein [Rhodomicrobium sp.]